MAYYTTTLPQSAYNTTGTITISTTASNYSGTVLSSNGYNNNWATIGSSSASQSSLSVTGDADFNGDVTIKGISILETLEKINERLAILVPDPERLEQYKALKKAYEEYKILEALCYKDKK
jgi:hypothetical protein